MTRVIVWALPAISLLLLVFGAACFNFTKPSGLAHHTRVAAEHGWPAPSDGIVGLGLVATIAGASGLSLAIRGMVRRK